MSRLHFPGTVSLSVGEVFGRHQGVSLMPCRRRGKERGTHVEDQQEGWGLLLVEHLSSLQEALVSIPSPMVKLGLEVHPCNLNTWKSGDRRIGRPRLSSATQRI